MDTILKIIGYGLGYGISLIVLLELIALAISAIHAYITNEDQDNNHL